MIIETSITATKILVKREPPQPWPLTHVIVHLLGIQMR